MICWVPPRCCCPPLRRPAQRGCSTARPLRPQKLVLPLAKQLLQGVWSPLSLRQSRAAAAMLGDLLVYVPAEEEAIQVGAG